MDGQQKIIPQELFYIGKYMRAQYIDYDYVRLMGDLTRKYSLKEKEIMAGLTDRGLLMEDFSGNMELNEEIRELLEPVFFGGFETEVILSIPQNGLIREKFHYYKERVTGVQVFDPLVFFKDGKSRLDTLKTQAIPETYTGNRKILYARDMEKIQDAPILVLKNMVMGKRASGKQFFYYEGTWYEGAALDMAQGLTGEEMDHVWQAMMQEG